MLGGKALCCTVGPNHVVPFPSLNMAVGSHELAKQDVLLGQSRSRVSADVGPARLVGRSRMRTRWVWNLGQRRL